MTTIKQNTGHIKIRIPWTRIAIEMASCESCAIGNVNVVKLNGSLSISLKTGTV